jgi:hypothetical protein
MLARSALRNAPLKAATRHSVRKTTTVCTPVPLKQVQITSSVGHPMWNFANDCIQRAASTSATEAASSPFFLNVTAAAATVAAVGSIGWYYEAYGQTIYAMTPVEEG